MAIAYQSRPSQRTMSGCNSEARVGKAPAPLAAALMVSLAAMNLSAANWPAWRGADGDGLCTETNVPLRWSPTENICWRTPLPEPGNSTPVVWNDHIFVTQNIGSRRSLMCFGRARGDLLWTAGVEVTARERSWHENPYCSPSPVTDGQRVICWFGSGGVVAYNFAGQELWRLDLGRHDHQYGYGSSPVLHGDLCFLNFGPGEREFVVAIDKYTGRELWRAVSPAPGRDDTLGTWSTPLLTTFAGRPQLVVALRDYLAALDPKTGKELWRCTGLGPQAKTSPVAGEGVVILSGDVQSAELAVKLGGGGRCDRHPPAVAPLSLPPSRQHRRDSRAPLLRCAGHRHHGLSPTRHWRGGLGRAIAGPWRPRGLLEFACPRRRKALRDEPSR